MKLDQREEYRWDLLETSACTTLMGRSLHCHWGHICYVCKDSLWAEVVQWVAMNTCPSSLKMLCLVCLQSGRTHRSSSFTLTGPVELLWATSTPSLWQIQCQDPLAHQQLFTGVLHWYLIWHCQGKLKRCFRNDETALPSVCWGYLCLLPQLPPPHLFILSVLKK